VTTGFWIEDHPNPAGRFYYPTRNTCQHGITQLPHLAVVHTAESLPDFTLPDTSGESLAKYASTTTRSVSWHSTVDSDGTIPMLPDSYTAFHVVDYNRCAVGMEIATKASLWGTADPTWQKQILGMAANQVAWWCKTHNLAVKQLTKAEADTGARGIISHARLDPTRRTDPGPAFPWGDFLTDVQARLTPGGYIDRQDWPAYAAASIQKAIDKGLMVGDGKMWYPNKVLTRAEIALILDRAGLL
jgi:N-acetyl-anhydromuramyl-L-alanine amidase AmpD